MKKNDPFVSIIVPTYNRANLIERSINSLLNQSYSNFEIIVVDDGSSDNTQEVIESFNEDKIKYYKHELNKGTPCAMNTGIKNSMGEFIAFQGSDDEWLPNKLEKEMVIFKESSEDVGVVYSGIWYIKKNKKASKIYTKNDIKGNIHEELLKGNFVNGLSVVRKICFQKVGVFDEELPNLEDWELYIRISKEFSFKYVDETLSKAYCSTDSESLKYDKLLKSSELIFKKHYDEFNKNKTIKTINCAHIGIWAFLSGDKVKAKKYLKPSIKRIDSIQLRFLIFYLLSYTNNTTYNWVLRLLKRFT